MRERVSMVGAEALAQETKLNRPIKTISYEPGNCYYRPALKSYRRNEVDETGKPIKVYSKGFARTFFFKEVLGVPVKDDFLGIKKGLELPIAYAKDILATYLMEASMFDTKQDTSKDEVDKKKMYANLIRYVTNFVENFRSSRDDDQFMSSLNSLLLFEPGEEQKADPSFDEDAFIIETFKEIYKSDIPKTNMTVASAMNQAAEKAMAAWSIENTDLQLAVTYTVNANFGAGKRPHGSIEPAENDGGAQLEQCKLLYNFARDIELHNFEEAGILAGADPNSQAYYEAFTKWLATPNAGNEIFTKPKPNGVAFVLSQLCNPDGEEVLKEGSKESPIESGIMNWSDNKTNTLEAEKQSGMLFADPDVCQTVFKFNASTDKAEAGLKMAIIKWSGKKLMPYEKVYELKVESLQSTTPDRINKYKPLDMQKVLKYFKELWVKIKDESWVTEELKAKHASAIELIEGSNTTADIVNEINAIAAKSASGASIISVEIEDDPEEEAAKPTPDIAVEEKPVPNIEDAVAPEVPMP